MTLTQNEMLRYSRQLPILGTRGQKKLKNAHVIVVGAGGLGCPALQNLVMSGIGKITIIDGDRIELSNLARQILYQQQHINQNKALTSASILKKLNPSCHIIAIDHMLSIENLNEFIHPCDVVIDACDNFNTRYLLNQQTRLLKIPLVSASIFRHNAQISTFNFKQGPCYECLYPINPTPEEIPNCAESGVIGAFTGIIGNIQALETIKIITSTGLNLSHRVLSIESQTMTMKVFSLNKANTCPIHTCAKENNMPNKSYEQIAQCILPKELNAIRKKESVVIIDVREPFEFEICKIEGALHIPLAQLKEKAETMDKNACYVVYCKAGIRGNKGAVLLKKLGFKHVYNLTGGILQWIDEVDDRLKRY